MKIGQISTWNEPCGVARNAASVHDLLNPYAEVTPLPLERSLVSTTGDRFSYRIAEKYLKSMVEECKNFDVVIWQHEPGLLGPTKRSYIRRSRLIARNLRNVIIVLHTVPPKLSFVSQLFDFFACLPKLTIGNLSALKSLKDLFYILGWKSLMKDIRKLLERDGVVVIHNERDAVYLQEAAKFPPDRVVIATPSNITSEMYQRKEELKTLNESRHSYSRVQTIFNHDKDAFWIAYIGFLNDYKGLDYALETLKILPDNFRLLVIGSVHERSADQFINAHPITKKLLSFNSSIKTGSAMDISPKKDEKINSKLESEIQDNSKWLQRVHFIATPSDVEITEAIVGSDAISLLYRNVNQSASGPLVEALELGATCVASNNKLFRSFRKVAGEQIRFVDVGNILQTKDSFLQLEKFRKVEFMSGNRIVCYPWTREVNFKANFSLGYSKAFKILGFDDIARSLDSNNSVL